MGDGEKGAIQHAIRHRLESALRIDWQTEAQVLYFIVQLRKSMEEFGDPIDPYAARTKFFCDWPLHPVMTQGRAMSQLKRFDELFSSTPDEFFNYLESTFTLELFREDLIHQLIAHRLPVEPIRKMQPWIDFLRLYLQLITDSPILDCGKKLKHIDRLQVTVDEKAPSDDLPQGAAFVFTIVWTFYKNRQVVREWSHQLVCPIDPKPGAFYQLHGPRI